MNEDNAHAVNRILKYAIAGSFSGMVLIGGVLWLDISSIKSMFTTSDNALLANLFLSGAMLKGAVFGAAVGTATLSLRRQPAFAGRPAAHRPTGPR